MPKSLARLYTVMALIMLFVLCQVTKTLAGTTGNIDGTVTDSAGHPVAAANVAAVAPSYRAQTVTGANGFYALNGLPPDTYALSFSKTGYQTQTIPGITINQDQTYTQNVALASEVVKTLSRVLVRGATSLVQPTITANQYTINPQTVTNITGTPQNISETAVLNALPGITTDTGGYPIIRGGAENDEGFALDGIDATEPVTGQFINSLSLNGVGRLQLSTGGYDVSEGNTNSGVVNVVIKRGAYPGAGEATVRTNWPNFDHRLSFDYGNATADNRFSYYVSYNGLRDEPVYGDTKTFLPRLLGATSFDGGDDTIVNLFYHWGANNSNELQYLGNTGSSLFNLSYGINPAITPYATNNKVNQGLFGPLINFTPLFPGQVGLAQNINYPDHEDENHVLQKINFKHQFSASSFGEFRVTRTQSIVNFLTPWSGGALADQYEFDGSDNKGVALNYSNQLNNLHEVSFGGETIFTRPFFVIAIPSSTMFTSPLEQGAPYNPAGYVIGLGGTGPLTLLPDNASHITDPIHRSNAYIKDRWTPTSHLTVVAGLRWDQEILELPANASAQNMFYTVSATKNVDGTFNYIDTPGQPIGSDVTRPSQISPRVALSYELNSRDVLKSSYGKFIEYTPLSNIENTYVIDPAAYNCTIANGCFKALPGGPGTITCCTNNVTTLAQQIIEDLNKNNFAQYTPVRPQRATSIDFSWEHDFGNGLQMKISPYYRKGTDYVVASTPLLFNLPDGTSVFGSPRESNAGVNKNTGVEFALDRNATYGWSGFLHATYDNTIANYNSDFFPSVNQAAVDVGHFFHVSYLAPVTAALNLNYNTRSGLHLSGTFPYESGYRYGTGKHTFIYLPTGPNGATQPHEVLNTDLAELQLGNNVAASSYYFTDPSNPGTILNPNITGSRGTNEGNDPGSITGPARLFANITIAQDLGIGQKRLQVGLHVSNLFGNYSNGVVGQNSRYRNNGIGGFAANSGKRSGFLAANEPYQFDRSPNPYENEPTGPARLWTLYLNARY